MKDYASELARLGADISDFFAEKIGRWSDTAPQGYLTTAELPALFALGEDLWRFQTAVADFEGMEDAFQRNFYPDIQEEGAKNQPELPESETNTSLPARHLENFPFVSGAPLPFFKTAQTTPDAGSKSRFEKAETAPDHPTAANPENTPERATFVQSRVGRSLPETASDDPGNGGTTSEPFLSKTPRPVLPRADFPGLKNVGAEETEGDKLKDPPPKTPNAQNPREAGEPRFFQHENTPFRETSKSPSPEVSEDIWRRPLQNLGGFASGFQQNTDIPPPAKNGVKPAANPQNNTSTNAALQMPAILETSQEQQIYPDPPPKKTELQVQITEQTTQQESRVPALQPHALDAPFDQTEDLLEALTRRIARDFKRYYP